MKKSNFQSQISKLEGEFYNLYGRIDEELKDVNKRGILLVTKHENIELSINTATLKKNVCEVEVTQLEVEINQLKQKMKTLKGQVKELDIEAEILELEVKETLLEFDQNCEEKEELEKLLSEKLKRISSKPETQTSASALKPKPKPKTKPKPKPKPKKKKKNNKKRKRKPSLHQQPQPQKKRRKILNKKIVVYVVEDKDEESDVDDIEDDVDIIEENEAQELMELEKNFLAFNVDDYSQKGGNFIGKLSDDDFKKEYDTNRKIPLDSQLLNNYLPSCYE